MRSVTGYVRVKARGLSATWWSLNRVPPRPFGLSAVTLLSTVAGAVWNDVDDAEHVMLRLTSNPSGIVSASEPKPPVSSTSPLGMFFADSCQKVTSGCRHSMQDRG